ncbi:MAG: metallophosphoesterase [Nanoarchaeota archaeon]
MKFLIIGDLHGNKPNIYYKDFDAIIAPGDFCSSEARPFMFQAMKKNFENPKNKVDWWDVAGKTKAKKLIKQSLKSGREILEFLDSFGVPVYLVPGNNDWVYQKKASWDFLNKNYYLDLKKNLKNVRDLNKKILKIKDYDILGYGINCGPEYPQYKRDMKSYSVSKLKKSKQKYKQLLQKYDKLFKKSKGPLIFLSHNVPFDTQIDKIVNKDSPRNGDHFGSLLTRKMIEKYQPLVCIGGHMHEHFGKCKIRKTTCINSGYGSYVNTLMELEGNKIKKLEFKYGKKGKYNPY